MVDVSKINEQIRKLEHLKREALYIESLMCVADIVFISESKYGDLPQSAKMNDLVFWLFDDKLDPYVESDQVLIEGDYVRVYRDGEMIQEVRRSDS